MKEKTNEQEKEKIKISKIEIRNTPKIRRNIIPFQIVHPRFDDNEKTKMKELKKKLFYFQRIKYYNIGEIINDPMCDCIIEGAHKFMEEVFQRAEKDKFLQVFLFVELSKPENATKRLKLEEAILSLALRDLGEPNNGITCAITPDALEMQKKIIQTQTCNIAVFYSASSALLYTEYFNIFKKALLEAMRSAPVILRSLFLRDFFLLERVQEKSTEFYRDNKKNKKAEIKGEAIDTQKRKVIRQYQQFLYDLDGFLLDFSE